MSYAEVIAEIKQTQANSGMVGFNEYGVPIHACHGYRHDAHYWVWIAITTQSYKINQL